MNTSKARFFLKLQELISKIVVKKINKATHNYKHTVIHRERKQAHTESVTVRVAQYISPAPDTSCANGG